MQDWPAVQVGLVPARGSSRPTAGASVVVPRGSANGRTSCRSRSERAVNCAGDLLARAGPNRAHQCDAPAFGSHWRALQPQVRKYRSLINVSGDLFGAALSGDMLSTRQLGAPAVASKTDEIFGYQRYRATRALLPRRVGRRVDDDLPNDSPTRMVRIAARDEKPRQRLRDPQRSRLGPVAVQVS